MNAPIRNPPIAARFGRRDDGCTAHLDDVYDAARSALDRHLGPISLQKRWGKGVALRLENLPAPVADTLAEMLDRPDVADILLQAMTAALPSTEDVAVAAVDAVLTDDLIHLVTTDEDVDLGLIESAVAELRGGRIANALTDLSRSCAGLNNLEDLVIPR